MIEFTTIEKHVITDSGTLHVVRNPDDIEPRTLVGKTVLLDGEPTRVAAVESPAIHWRPGMHVFRNLGLLIR